MFLLMIKTNLDINELKDITNLKLLLFAETHNFINDLVLQKEILKILKPKYYLYEMLEEKSILNKEDFDSFLSKKDNINFSVISTYGELKPTIELAKENNLKVIGCDIKNMCRSNKDFLTKTSLTKEEEKTEIDILEKREKRQAKIINEYLKKDEGLIFVCLGAYHLRDDSPLFKEIRNKKYLICQPTYDGELLFGPTQDTNKEKIEYKIEIKEK